MKLLFDLFPVLIFFGTFKYAESHREAAAEWLSALIGTVDAQQAPILLSTVVVIVATVLQIAWVRWRHGRVDKMLWISLVLVSFFGGLTLIFHDESFIKWKPTILYWIFAGGLAFSQLVLQKNAIRAMLQEQISLPEHLWIRVNLSWIVFFTAMGGLNLLVAYHFPTDIWVNFKLFGGMGLLILFVLGQSLLLSKYIEEKK